MGKKLFAFFLSLAVAVTMTPMIAFAADDATEQNESSEAITVKETVDADDGDEAEHEWSVLYEYDDTKHWRACEDEGCDAITDEGEHEFNDDGICESCEYVGPTHTHGDSDWFYLDSKRHCKVCPKCYEEYDIENHVDDDGDGYCDKCDEEYNPNGSGHVHSWAGFDYDATQHWWYCEDVDCGEIKGLENHDFDENGLCDLCGYVDPSIHKEHIPSADADGNIEWHYYDDENHSKVCSVCEEEYGIEKHVDTDKDGKCDKCFEYVDEPHEHIWESGKYGWNCEEHYLVCQYCYDEDEDWFCAEPKPGSAEAHTFKDGVCTVCGAKKGGHNWQLVDAASLGDLEWPDEYAYGKHYYKCSECGECKYEAHEYDETGEKCAKCGYEDESGEATAPHVHKWSTNYYYSTNDFDMYDELAPGCHFKYCLEPGCIVKISDVGEHKDTNGDDFCDVCHKYMGEGTHIHSYSEWKYQNARYHSRTCTTPGCERTQKCKHSMVDGVCTVCGCPVHEHAGDWQVTEAAGLNKAGKAVKKCSVCDYEMETKEIPAISSVNLAATSYAYRGTVKTPAVTVKDAAGNSLVKDKDYTVSYSSGRKNVGKYKVTVTFKGDYTGTKVCEFKINPNMTPITKLTKGKKSFKVKWKKRTKQVTGYQIRYSTSPKMTGAKYRMAKGYKTTTKTVKKLKSKKKYYVQVRTYKTVSGVKYFSGWSKVKTVKTR